MQVTCRSGVPGLEDVTLQVWVDGDGPTVLLLHGFPDSHALWRAQVPVLVAAGYRVVAPDLRGFGKSDRPDAVAAYRMPVLLADVDAVLDAVGADRAIVVGHDWGAVLTWAYARAHPQRVQRLVAVSVGHPLANAAAGIPQLQLSWYMLWFLFPGAAETVLPRDDWAAYRRWAGGTSGAGDEYLAQQIRDLSTEGALAAGLNWYRANIEPPSLVARAIAGAAGMVDDAIAMPALGVWSSDDAFLGEEQMRRTGEHIAGDFRYERIEAVDHWVPVRGAQQLNALLLDFLGTR